LARRHLTAETLVFEGCKSLDFLGFSRAKRAFSRGYAGFSLEEISRAPCRYGARMASVLCMQKRKIAHGISLM
jgi:hypothetical protein